MTTSDSSLRDDRIWIDGCFDFAHHGHAGAMLQARQLGTELFVGVHSDEAIGLNKGPVVMSLNERVAAVDACKWSTASVAGAPYVTDPKVMDDYGCRYVVHGDDITTDADGNDCYQVVKDCGRFLVVKRTPNISTTDLVGRMLSTSTSHHIAPIVSTETTSLGDLKTANAGHHLFSDDSLERFRLYATAADGKSAGAGVFVWRGDNKLTQVIEPSSEIALKLQSAGQVYYVDGGFDLFFMGHIEFLKVVHARAKAAGAIVVVGIHDDATVNSTKGKSYPIMNLFERALCVLQCRYVDAVILGAPFVPSAKFLAAIGPEIKVTKVLHGPTPIETQNGEAADDEEDDPYKDAKAAGIFEQVESHPYQRVSSATIVERVLSHREEYEERQRRKGWKAENEKKLEAAEKESIAGVEV
ncbi:uncharacterized protein SAPINGB_P000259 [Magnusiomyces paraingens]|uniref:ethanolamine-phosphate cytidylyltransferase n=1 Tax=Magnusiomyces paraingens TaxID=2606893 RepID=A0A5E8AZ83_9ASCO|nr:uncharacterized protein SAPINGB_P000259 [Saprochaete ingens]VVT44014.1 unnamed protein product [Saprochaete ingens]